MRTISLRNLVTLSWIIPGSFAFLASLIAFALLAWLDYRGVEDATTKSLSAHGATAARRISAEMLLGEHGRVDEVVQILRDELKIPALDVVSENVVTKNEALNTASSRAPRLTQVLAPHEITVYQRIAHTPAASAPASASASTSASTFSLTAASYVRISAPIAPLWSYFNPRLFAWSAAPIFLFLAVGLALQRMLINRYVIIPVQSLVQVAEARAPIPAQWPSEILDIAQELGRSFHAREEAVFAMLAKGIVHDIKTWVHSLLTATELASEASPDLRPARLEALLKASTVQLPKIKRTIELALDGGRTIELRREACALGGTVRQAVESVRPQADAAGVRVSADLTGFNDLNALDDLKAFNDPKAVHAADVVLAHDAIQLEHALVNLLKNGIEAASAHTSPGLLGPREVTVSLVPSTGATSPSRPNPVGAFFISILIEDSGPGLHQDLHLNFKPTRSTKAGGSGLGLYIANKIVRAHGGAITARRSTTLGGAAFTVTIPTELPLGGAT